MHPKTLIPLSSQTQSFILVHVVQVDSAEGRVMFDDTTIISPLPLFHIYGFTMSMLYTAFKGATLVTMEVCIEILRVHVCATWA